MSIFSSESFDGHEIVAFFTDSKSGLKAIIAVHDSTLGPALGGCRMWSYANDEEALTDVLRLSRGMTYKNALAGLPWGGGKAVVLGDARKDKTPEMFQALGRAVESLGGRYITAEDVGTTPDDMFEVAKETDHVRGVKNVGHDPSPGTAFGVFKGIEATALARFGTKDLTGLRATVQGLGHVGYDVARRLRSAGAKLTVADVNQDALARAEQELGATIVDPDAIYDVDADLYVPCALGATVNAGTIARLKVKAIAGAANNQLATDEDGDALAERGILYAPDYVINAGGVIHIFHDGPQFDQADAFMHIAKIGDTLGDIFKRAKRDGIATHRAADALARERLRPLVSDEAA